MLLVAPEEACFGDVGHLIFLSPHFNKQIHWQLQFFLRSSSSGSGNRVLGQEYCWFVFFFTKCLALEIRIINSSQTLVIKVLLDIHYHLLVNIHITNNSAKFTKRYFSITILVSIYYCFIHNLLKLSFFEVVSYHHL